MFRHRQHSDPALRPRFSPESVLASRVNGQDMYGALGDRTPAQPPFSAGPNGFYTYHPADVFYPGAGAWVLDQKFENPLMCQWGHGTMLRPNRGLPVYGTINGTMGTVQPPAQAPAVTKTATPWGTALPYSYPALNAQSAQVNQDGTFELKSVDYGIPSGDY